MPTKITPNLMVHDVRETIAFYQEVLGFTLLATVPDTQDVPAETPLNWAMMRYGDNEGATLMFQARHSLREDAPILADVPIGASQSLFMDVADVQAQYQRLKERVRIVNDWHATFYGTHEFYFLDCNGYVLCYAGRANEPDSESLTA